MPIDWDTSQADDTLSISYRVLGASHTERPYLFLIGGGPGMASIEHYFTSDAQQDGLAGYSKYFRVVLFDQRGTGTSSPVEEDSEQLSAELSMKYFTARSHAKDLGELVRHLNASNDDFYLMAHSYGGVIAHQYLADREAGPVPKGLILASVAPALIDAYDFLKQRVLHQIHLNHQHLPEDFRQKVLAAKEKIVSIDYVTSTGRKLLPEDLGLLSTQAVHTSHRKFADELLDQILKEESDGKTIEDMLRWHATRLTGNRFMHALSCCDLTAPHSELDLFERVYQEVKPLIEDWMLLELHAFQAMSTSPQFQPWGIELREAAPLWGLSIDGDEVRTTLKKMVLIDLAADQDPYVPYTSSQKNFELLATEPYHHQEPLKGGDHWSSLLPHVADFVFETLRSKEALLPNTCTEFALP